MSFELVDLGDSAHRLRVNAWNWRPTLAMIQAWGLLEADQVESLGFNGGAAVTATAAQNIGRRFREAVLPHLPPQGRVLYDLTLTTQPDDGTFYREPGTLWQNYSASAAWLAQFVEFCATCQGFEVH